MTSVPQFPPSHVIPEDETVEKVENPASSEEKEKPREPLALPAPKTGPDEPKALEVGGDPLKLDHLGPMVVNTDGTLSRIHNWPEMTESERERTMRILAKRNKSRMEALKASGVTLQ